MIVLRFLRVNTHVPWLFTYVGCSNKGAHWRLFYRQPYLPDTNTVAITCVSPQLQGGLAIFFEAAHMFGMWCYIARVTPGGSRNTIAILTDPCQKLVCSPVLVWCLHGGRRKPIYDENNVINNGKLQTLRRTTAAPHCVHGCVQPNTYYWHGDLAKTKQKQ